ncbi:cadherin repeat domain-containing protein, partial [archaeon]
LWEDACAAGSTAAQASSQSLTCGNSGAWSSSPLLCIPPLTVTPPFRVLENAASGTPIGAPLSLSPLPTEATLAFTITSTSPAGAPFAIGDCDGQLRLATEGVLNYASGPRSYVININAHVDAVVSVSDSVATITVEVLDTPDPPTLQAATFAVPENATAGATVGTVQCNDVDGFPLTARLEFNPDNLFALSGPADSGSTMPAAGRFTLTLARAALDFERTRAYSVIISCTDSTDGTPLSTSATYVVNVQDVPEPPLFLDVGLNCTIAENATVGTMCTPSLMAVDPENATLTFALLSPSSTFTLNPGGTFVLTNTALLDHESLPVHALRVRATDASGLSVEATAHIFVTDINEPPSFVNTSRAVAETARVRDPVGAPLVATDPEDVILHYAITQQPVPGLFALEELTGQLTVHGALDFFARDSYQLYISVTDSGTPNRVPIAIPGQVRINVTWVNSPPVAAASTFSILENAAPSALVGRVNASDRDARAPIWDTLSYSLSSQSPRAASGGVSFTVDAATGDIRVGPNAGLDYEGNRTYALSVRVADANGGVSFAAITINLLNVNEAPLFPATPISFSALSRVAQSVGRPLSTLILDPDVAAPGSAEHLTFSFPFPADNVDATFAIDATTGQITVATPSAAFFTTGSVYSLRVRATDAGIDGPPLSVDGVVTITVVDNNQPPSCVAMVSLLSIAERAAHGTVVGTVTCTDPDMPQQSLTYSLSPAGGNVNRPFPFTISSANSVGTIRVALTPDAPAVDFEGLFSSYNASITATDSHASALTGSASLTIRLTDVPEPPYFVAGPGGATANPGVLRAGAFTLSVAENSVAGVVAAGGPLQGYDQDASDGGGALLTYAWDASTPAATSVAFAIDTNTAHVRVAPGVASGVLNFEAKAVYTGVVRVTDRAGAFDLANVTVNLLDVNEAPLFNSPPVTTATDVAAAGSQLSVPENTPAGAVIGRVHAYDVDAGAAGELRFAIVNSVDTCGTPGTTVFRINATSGVLSAAPGAASGLNWEDCVSYALTVSVTDAGSPPLASSLTVNIAVTDVDDAVLLDVLLLPGEETAGRGID